MSVTKYVLWGVSAMNQWVVLVFLLNIFIPFKKAWEFYLSQSLERNWLVG